MCPTAVVVWRRMSEGGDGLERISVLNVGSGKVGSSTVGGVFGADPHESPLEDAEEVCLARVRAFCNSSSR